jgi:hypothetical protein
LTLEILAIIVLPTQGHAETPIVVPVLRVVVVAVRRAEILRIVVPRAAAKDTTGRPRRPAQTGPAQGKNAPILVWRAGPHEAYPQQKIGLKSPSSRGGFSRRGDPGGTDTAWIASLRSQ